MESKERLQDDFAEAQSKRKLLKDMPTGLLLEELRSRDIHDDVRIRLVSRDGKFRVVAPTARRANGTVYINNILVIEQSTKDSLGGKVWSQVGQRMVDNESYSRSDPSVTMPRDQHNAIHVLLADSER